MSYNNAIKVGIRTIMVDVGLMRWIGPNAYCTSHYPYSEDEMQMVDRDGFLIIDGIPMVSLQMADEANFPERTTRVLGEWVYKPYEKRFADP